MRNVFGLDQERAFQSETIRGPLAPEDVPVLRAITTSAVGDFFQLQTYRSVHESSQNLGVKGFGQVDSKVI